MDLKTVLKIVTGIIIVPLGIAASTLWPWWVRQVLPVKILSGVIVLPLMLIAGLSSTWWNDF